MATKESCKDKLMALAILRAISEPMKAGTQKTALESVADWIMKTDHSDIHKMTREQREARIVELMTSERNCMSIEERRERAAFYLDTVITKKEFDAMSEAKQNAFLKSGGLVDMGKTKAA